MACATAARDGRIEYGVGPVYYPSSIHLLYSNALVMVRRHISDCAHLNDDLRLRYEALLKNSKGKRMDGVSTYWAAAAASLGLVNTRGGIRFSPASLSSSQTSSGITKEVVAAQDATVVDAMVAERRHTRTDPANEISADAHGVDDTASSNVDATCDDRQKLSETNILALCSESGRYPCPAIGEGWTCRVNPPRIKNGRVDRYWYTPKGNMLKSAGAVIRFLAAVEKSGDERKALKIMKRMKVTSALRESVCSTTETTTRKEENAVAASAGDETPNQFDVPANSVIEKAGTEKTQSTASIEDENGDTKKHFAQVLHEILCNAGNDPDVAKSMRWTSTGKAFEITDEKLFERKILPRISERCSCFSSFNRRLYMWGFTKPRKGPNAGRYYHRLFQRDQEGLCHSIASRGENKKTTKQRSPRAPDLDLTTDQGRSHHPLTTPDVQTDNSPLVEDVAAPSANIALLATVLAANASPIVERYGMNYNATRTETGTDRASSGADEDSASAAQALLQLFTSGGD